MARADTAAVSVVQPADAALDAQAEEAGRRLFAGPCDFVAGAGSEAALPPGGVPEIAVAGRSNVGKSSLVNALTGRTTLARVSHRPGRTQQLNFFDLAGRLMLVDLPGYGYAEASKHDIERWSLLVRRYLAGRASLRRTLLLVDARHGLKPPDLEVMEILDKAAVSFQAVLTKIDKVPRAALAEQVDVVAAGLKAHVAAHPVVHLTSAHEGSGIAALRASLGALALPAPAKAPSIIPTGS